jgi:hypothetical protein
MFILKRLKSVLKSRWINYFVPSLISRVWGRSNCHPIGLSDGYWCPMGCRCRQLNRNFGKKKLAKKNYRFWSGLLVTNGQGERQRVGGGVGGERAQRFVQLQNSNFAFRTNDPILTDSVI